MKIKILILLVGTFILVYIVTLIKGDYRNKVVFTGDEWDYQTIGVNSYYGYEFLTTGRIKEIEAYKFEELDNGKIEFWEKFSGKKAYYRVPFYPLFLSLTYKLFGINPIIVKYIQLFLIIFSGLLLVLIGRIAWGKKGFYIGFLSFILFVVFNYKFSEHLMPENWQFLFLSLITICLFYHYNGSRTYSILLGIILGMSCLNKGTTFFLFPLIILADLFHYRFKDKRHWQNMILFAIGFVVITGLWSIYLSNKRDQFTFISSQIGEVLLDGNNEYCSNGLWHPEWREKSNSFYNNDKMNNRAVVFRVVNFYMENPKYLSNFPAKIRTGFAPVYSFIVLISFYLILISFSLYQKSRFITNGLNKSITNTIIFLLFFFSIYFVLFLGTLNDMLFFSIVFLIIPLSIVFCKRILKTLILPFQFFIIFLNFLIFTLTFYVCNETYLSRYVKTMDGIFILVCVYLFLEIISVSKNTFLRFKDNKNSVIF